MGCSRKAYFVMMAMASLGMVMMSGCGKNISTTRISEVATPEVKPEAKPEAKPAIPPPEHISEPLAPKVEITREHEIPPEAPVSIPVKGPEKVMGINDIYFDFDRYLIRDDAKKTLTDNAGTLKGKGFKKIVIEGHCDERGTTDYNLALGERRADAAKRYMATLGVDASRISIISFGKEKPFCKEHNEECWQNNRRAHFVVTE